MNVKILFCRFDAVMSQHLFDFIYVRVGSQTEGHVGKAKGGTQMRNGMRFAL